MVEPQNIPNMNLSVMNMQVFCQYYCMCEGGEAGGRGKWGDFMIS